MTQQKLPELDYNKLQIGEELGSYEYVLTQQMLEEYRKSVDDPEGVFPTIAVKHDATALAMVYNDTTGGVNAGNEIELHNPPIPGKKIRVTGRRNLRLTTPFLWKTSGPKNLRSISEAKATDIRPEAMG